MNHQVMQLALPYVHDPKDLAYFAVLHRSGREVVNAMVYNDRQVALVIEKIVRGTAHVAAPTPGYVNVAQVKMAMGVPTGRGARFTHAHLSVFATDVLRFRNSVTNPATCCWLCGELCALPAQNALSATVHSVCATLSRLRAPCKWKAEPKMSDIPWTLDAWGGKGCAQHPKDNRRAEVQRLVSEIGFPHDDRVHRLIRHLDRTPFTKAVTSVRLRSDARNAASRDSLRLCKSAAERSGAVVEFLSSAARHVADVFAVTHGLVWGEDTTTFNMPRILRAVRANAALQEALYDALVRGNMHPSMNLTFGALEMAANALADTFETARTKPLGYHHKSTAEFRRRLVESSERIVDLEKEAANHVDQQEIAESRIRCLELKLIAAEERLMQLSATPT
jgi:hypothetical protein